jgi:hypothetical protein
MAGARYPGWRRKPAPEPPPTPPAPAPPNLAPAAPVQAAFAEADRSRDAIDAYLELVDWEAAMEPVARSIEDLVLASPSLEAAAQRLVGLFTGDAGAALTEQLARALLQAGLAGQGGLALSDREDRAQAAD